jgi:hypothetical protein
MCQLIEVWILEFKTEKQSVAFSLLRSDLFVIALVTIVTKSVTAQRYNVDLPLASSSLVKCACSYEISVVQYNFLYIYF